LGPILKPWGLRAERYAQANGPLTNPRARQ
jgi:hypothetical protein